MKRLDITVKRYSSGRIDKVKLGRESFQLIYDHLGNLKAIDFEGRLKPTILDITTLLLLVQEVKNSVVKMLDEGDIIRAHGSINNGVVVLYTVPPERDFYWLHYSVTGIAGAGNAECTLLTYDPAGIDYSVDGFIADAPVTHGHSSGQFTFTKLPSAWQVGLYANAATDAYAAIMGVLTDA